MTRVSKAYHLSELLWLTFHRFRRGHASYLTDESKHTTITMSYTDSGCSADFDDFWKLFYRCSSPVDTLRSWCVVSSDTSVPVLSHYSGTIQGVRGSAILTVDTNSGLKPAYFFTFVPDPSPMLSRSLHGGKSREIRTVYIGRERAAGAAEGKRGNVMVWDYDSLPRPKYVIPLSPLFN
jgi:hypothetical protein